jgi:hypothetical protein
VGENASVMPSSAGKDQAMQCPEWTAQSSPKRHGSRKGSKTEKAARCQAASISAGKSLD